MKGVSLAGAGLALATVGSAIDIIRSTPVYKNPNASVDARVADLLERMTIEEKASQLIQGDISNWVNTTTGAFNASGLVWSMQYRGSSFYVGYPTDFSLVNDGVKIAQDYLVKNTTLGIPALVQSEGIHGFLMPNATIFNSPIAYACSWNPDLVQKMAGAIAQEALALGVNQLFAPLGDLARELRYGRVEETFGEDPYLTGEMAYSYVKGLQAGGVAATVKHFAAFASPEQGLNTAPVHGGVRELLTTYMPSYKRAIVDAGAYSIMSAYSSYDGVPAVANKLMLTDILRTSWGYKVSVSLDWASIMFTKLTGDSILSCLTPAAPTVFAAPFSCASRSPLTRKPLHPWSVNHTIEKGAPLFSMLRAELTNAVI
jgi:beta-glucosidase